MLKIKNIATLSRYLLVLFVFVSGVMISLFLFKIVNEWDSKNIKFDFDTKAGDRFEIIVESLKGNVDVLYFLDDFYRASVEVERKEFFEFTKNIFIRHKDIDALSWIPRIPDKQLSLYEEKAFLDGLKQFQITALDKNGNIVKSQKHKEYFPMYFIEPYKINEFLIGLDVSSDSSRWEAMKLARDSGRPQASAKIKLLRQTDGDFGCRVFFPVYKKGVPLETVKERRSNLIGFNSLLFRIGETVNNALRNISSAGINIYIYDKSAKGKSDLLYEYLTGKEAVLENKTGVKWGRDFMIAGRVWYIECRPNKNFFITYKHLPSLFILISGIGLTFILTLYLLSLLMRTRQIENMIKNRTIELNKANKELEKLVRQNQLILNCSGEGIAGFDGEGNFIFANPAAAKMLGYEVAELIGKSGHSIAHYLKPNGEVYPQDECPIYKTFKDGQVHRVNDEFLFRKDGTSFPVEYISMPITEADKLVGAVVTFSDITERKKTEINLQLSEAKYRELVENANSIILKMDTKGNVTFFNEFAQDFFGFKDTEIIGKNVIGTIVAETESTGRNLREMIFEIEKDPQRYARLENENILRNGKKVWVAWTNKAIYDEKGNLSGVLCVGSDVTQRKHIEDSLQQAYQLTRAILNMAPFGIYIINKEGAIEYVNPAMVTISGDSYEQFINLHAFDLPSYKEIGLDKKIQEVFLGRSFSLGPVNYTSYYSKKHTVRNFIGIPLEENFQKKALIFVEDVTEIEKAKDLLKEAKERAELLYKVTPSGIYTVDAKQRVTSWNDKAAEITGYSYKEIIGKDCRLFSDLPCNEKCGLHEESILKPINAQICTIRRKDGQLRIISKNSDLLKDVNGNITGGIESFEDITERQYAQEQVRLAAQEWEKTFNAISDMIFIQDRNNTIINVNKSFTDAINLSRKDIVGKKCYHIVHGLEKSIEMCPFEQTKKDNISHTEEIFEPRLEKFLLVTTSPMFDEGGNLIGSVHIAKDITELKKTEQKIKEAIEIKSNFISTVSHELRTPLSVIKESINLVVDETVGVITEKQKEFLNIAKKNSDRLSRLINNVLDFQKLTSGKRTFTMQNNDINETIAEVKNAMLSFAQGKGLDIKLDLGSDISRFNFDKDAITQVLTNLIANSIKFTDKGDVTVSTKEQKDSVQVSVRDTGIGIKREDIEKLFQKFTQVDKDLTRKVDGTGLGLAICKEIIDRHNGKIWVESEYGKGASFIFILPVT